MGITLATIALEQVAIQIYATWSGATSSWDYLSEEARNTYRNRARTVLTEAQGNNERSADRRP